ncbi:hypothetical protein GUITHDRAFT_62571, partial [Guillardia theta CCMP2712]
CYHCGRWGHIAPECWTNSRYAVSEWSVTSNRRTCFQCGKTGHFASECYANKRRRTETVECFNCGKPGHFASEC